MKKKTISLLIIACCCCLLASAQGNIVVEMSTDLLASYARFIPIDTLDWASMECIYEYRVRDKDKSETYFDILQLGREYTKYFGYPRYRVDSVIYRRDINKITNQEAGEVYNRYRYTESSPYIILIHNRTKKISYYDRVFTDHYIYTDSAPIAWQLSTGSLVVCGHYCHKATAHFRGREWTAYYAPDIPVGRGPWKFGGLPGLILRIEDSTGDQCFTAISLRTIHSDIYMERDRDDFKTTRERFNKQLKDYRSNPSKIISGSPYAPKDDNGREVLPKRKLFFNPIELE